MKEHFAWGMVAGVAGYLLLERLGHRWGATDDEAHRLLPGDEIVPHPMVETTHALTVRAPAAAIWPWLVQAGYGRGGWYTDERLDRLQFKLIWANIVPPDERSDFIPSAEKILPEFQNLKVGDIVPDGIPGTAYFVVKGMERDRFLALHSTSHIKYAAPAFFRGTRLEPHGEFSWVFVLDEIHAAKTRLILRTRANYGPPLFRVLGKPIFMLSEILFPYLILSGVRKRAENELRPAHARS